MTSRFQKASLLLAMLLAVSIGRVAFADATLEYRGPQNARLSFLFAPGRMRVDVTIEHLSGSILYDEAARKMWIVDHARRSYVEVGEDLLRQIREVRRQMESRLSQLPPAVREQMERMLTPPGFVRISVPQDLCESPKVIGTETIRGLVAKVVDGCRSLVGGEWVTCRGWFVDGSALGLDLKDLRVLESFLAFYLEFLRTVGLPEFLGDSHLLLTQPRPPKTLDLGLTFPVPVKGAAVKDGREFHTVFLEKVSTGPLPGAVFTAPKGYTEIKIRLPQI
ncbi:MAG: hypothetical protein QN198_07050 [Armatimonadota bacterium]|nr:hypothetical protein [Armatimonadota bacterium]